MRNTCGCGTGCCPEKLPSQRPYSENPDRGSERETASRPLFPLPRPGRVCNRTVGCVVDLAQKKRSLASADRPPFSLTGALPVRFLGAACVAPSPKLRVLQSSKFPDTTGSPAHHLHDIHEAARRRDDLEPFDLQLFERLFARLRSPWTTWCRAVESPAVRPFFFLHRRPQPLLHHRKITPLSTLEEFCTSTIRGERRPPTRDLGSRDERLGPTLSEAGLRLTEAPICQPSRQRRICPPQGLLWSAAS